MLTRGEGSGAPLTKKGREMAKRFVADSDELKALKQKLVVEKRLREAAEVGREKAEAARKRERVAKEQAQQEAESEKAKKLHARREKRALVREVEDGAKKLRRETEKTEVAEWETAGMAQELGELENDFAEMSAQLKVAVERMSKAERQEFDSLVQESRSVEPTTPTTPTTVSLVGALGKKNQLWSQDVIELGMELMEKGLTAPQVGWVRVRVRVSALAWLA